MKYWNQDNFEGLNKIGEKYSSIAGYEDFARYCLLKEKGLRKEANKSIENFILSTERKNEQEQRKIAEALSKLSYNNRNVHQLIPHQLQQFLMTVLKKWAEADPNYAIPYRWLGFIGNDVQSYIKALEIEPSDEISLTAVINFHLDSVDYQTHHLSESLFIGKIGEAKESLDKAEELLKRIGSIELKEVFIKEYQYYRNLIKSWEEYKKAGYNIGFPEWVEARGENYRFNKAYYYEK